MADLVCFEQLALRDGSFSLPDGLGYSELDTYSQYFIFFVTWELAQ
jgi:hypothetical protein